MNRIFLAVFASISIACNSPSSRDAAVDIDAMLSVDVVSDAQRDGFEAATMDAIAPRDVPPPPDVVEPDGPPLFNWVFRAATHNSYWINRDPQTEFFASGVQERLIDQLMFEHARAIEIDVHRDRTVDHVFRVFHTDKETNSLCSPLSECMHMLRSFHYALPQHEAVAIVIELKELSEDNFDPTHTPVDLDQAFIDDLREPDGQGGYRSWLYTPRDFLARCDPGSTMVDCARTHGWPTIAELRGKFLVMLQGNWHEDITQVLCMAAHPMGPCPARANDTIEGHGPAGWVEYATFGGGASERTAFSMRSNWVQFNAGPGTEQVDPTLLIAANNASAVWQVEDLTDPLVPWFLAQGGIVRGHDSFSIDDQYARVSAGYQYFQTDYPWVQYDNRGVEQPLRPLRDRTDVNSFLEPGKRLYLRGPVDDSQFGFAYTTVSVDGCTSWQTLVSLTRESPDPTYPNRARTRGTGCIRASTDPTNDSLDHVSLCRSTADGEFAHVTLDAMVSGTTTRVAMLSPAREAAGPGEWIKLTICSQGSQSTVTAFTAGDVAMTGEQGWLPVGSMIVGGRLRYQGIAAARDVLFVATQRDGANVSSFDLNAPVVTNSTNLPGNIADTTLIDLSYPASTAACHDPIYPAGCRN